MSYEMAGVSHVNRIRHLWLIHSFLTDTHGRFSMRLTIGASVSIYKNSYVLKIVHAFIFFTFVCSQSVFNICIVLCVIVFLDLCN